MSHPRLLLLPIQAGGTPMTKIHLIHPCQPAEECDWLGLAAALTYAHCEAQGIEVTRPLAGNGSVAPGSGVGKVGLGALTPNGADMQPRSESHQSCDGLGAGWGIQPADSNFDVAEGLPISSSGDSGGGRPLLSPLEIREVMPTENLGGYATKVSATSASLKTSRLADIHDGLTIERLVQTVERTMTK